MYDVITVYDVITAECPADTHGPNCKNICGHCYGVDACDVLNGNCMHGCEPGYTGRTCTEGYLHIYYIITARILVTLYMVHIPLEIYLWNKL